MNTLQAIEIKKLIKDPQTTVIVLQSQDLGDPVWAVQVSDYDFWINSFETEERALTYCRRMNLKVIPNDSL